MIFLYCKGSSIAEKIKTMFIANNIPMVASLEESHRVKGKNMRQDAIEQYICMRIVPTPLTKKAYMLFHVVIITYNPISNDNLNGIFTASPIHKW